MKAVVADYRYRVLCLRIVPTVGTTVRLTHHPRDLTMGNGQIYKAFSGHDFTGYSASATAAPSVIDLEGILGAGGITRAQVASGVYDGARCYLFATTWKTPVEDEEQMMASILGKTTLMDDRFRIEEMALVDALNQSVGDSYSAGCKKVFGGQEYAGCKKALGPITVTGTLTAVTSAAIFRDAGLASGGGGADYFAAGTIRFTSGNNAGLKAIEVKRYEADGTIETFEPFHYTPQVGDTYSMVPGCRKRLEDCRDKWANIANFGGFSFIPTTSTYTQVGTK